MSPAGTPQGQGTPAATQTPPAATQTAPAATQTALGYYADGNVKGAKSLREVH